MASQQLHERINQEIVKTGGQDSVTISDQTAKFILEVNGLF
jgi:hypothetical protein